MCRNTARRSSTMFSVLVVAIGCCSVLLMPSSSSTTTTSSVVHAIETTTYSASGKTTMVRRERNLDHWDSDTLAIYLDEDYPGHDVAIMFYASWDRHSQALAPYWDRIATILDAGNSQSRLVMALFDCELNVAHAQLCEAVGVTVYPTLLFIGSSPFYDSDVFTRTIFGSRAVGPFGEAPVPRTVKFQGNWQYTDSVLDWIRTMQALSNWHIWSNEGFGRKLRNLFFPYKKSNTPLPVGAPRRGGGSSMSVAPSLSGGGAAGAGASNTAEVQLLQSKVEQYKSAAEDMEKIALRSTTMLESILLNENENKEVTDMFQLLDERNLWTDKESNTALDEIYRNCVMEVSLDYCQRAANKVGMNIVEDLEKSLTSTEEMLAAAESIEATILEKLTKKEPYCGILESCIANDYKDPACRPNVCPFTNDAACQYLTSCMEPEIMAEYAEALGINISEDDKASGKEDEKKGWGIFA